MIAPLLWLMLSALGLLHPAEPGVRTWQGAPPVVVTTPTTPTAGDTFTVAIGALPHRAHTVEVEAATIRYAAHRSKGLWVASFQPQTQGGPLELTVLFSVGDRRYRAPGGVVLVGAQELRAVD